MTIRALFAAVGSLGDVYPLLATAIELQKRGHRVAFAASPEYRNRIEQAGIAFRPLPLHDAEAEHGHLFYDLARIYPRFIELAVSGMPKTFDSLLLHSQEADIIIAGEIVYPARLVAAARGIPWVNCIFAPHSLESQASPGFGFPPEDPLLSHLGKPSREVRVRLVKQLGMSLHSLCRAHRIPSSAVVARPDATIALFSPFLVDSTENKVGAEIVGFPQYQGVSGEIPGRLREFLNAGSAPIVFAFGTTAVHALDDHFYATVLSAANQLNCRTVLLTGMGPKPRAIPTDGSAFSTDEYVSYLTCFRHARVVLHHGGIGTMAAAIRAGAPALIIPFAFDQCHNAAIARRRGVARVLAYGDCRPDPLARELSALLDDPSYLSRTKELSGVIGREDGAGEACRIIEQLCDGSPVSSKKHQSGFATLPGALRR